MIFIFRLNKDYDQAMNNLGNILKEKGQLVEAEQLLLNAVSIRSVQEFYGPTYMHYTFMFYSCPKYKHMFICPQK